MEQKLWAVWFPNADGKEYKRGGKGETQHRYQCEKVGKNRIIYVEGEWITLGGSKASISASDALGNRSLIVLFNFLRSAPDSLCCVFASTAFLNIFPSSLSLSLKSNNWKWRVLLSGDAAEMVNRKPNKERKAVALRNRIRISHVELRIEIHVLLYYIYEYVD